MDRSNHHFKNVIPDGAPLLVTTIDAEEEFDWSAPLSRNSQGVGSMRQQYLAHKIFDRFGIVASYFATYPILQHEDGYKPLCEYLQNGKCEVGAQLHPWVTPPFPESVGVKNSFPGNLSFDAEYSKLASLTELLTERLGHKPTIYRAGRYGIGPNTAAILMLLGYRIDSSVVPEYNYDREGGPDFSQFSPNPSWVDPEKRLLELPITSGYVGLLGQNVTGRKLFSRASGHGLLRSVAARAGLFERIRLTPEGTTYAEAQRLVRSLARRGVRVFTLSYHTPSLTPGVTPYVRTLADRDRFLDWLERFYEFFLGEMGGKPASVSDVLALATANAQR
ncbi:MAG: polysaccharide deacetylase family protein [Rhizomicrobium sp.]